MTENLKSIKHVFLILSGKGGVGKSTFAVQFAQGLVKQGKKVGILDVDLCGPSIPHMLKLKGKDIHQCTEGWVPVYTDSSQNLAVMSIAFLLKNENDAVVWRGPKKNAMIKQFLSDVYWKDVEYLVIDTPPGTSDEHISTVEALQALHPDGAILITTPQNVATADVKRELTFCRKTSMPVLGIVENMSGYVCPSCKECSNIFSSGGGEELAKHAGVTYLGNIPFDPLLASALDEGSNMMDSEDSPTTKAINQIINLVTS
ncbi:cytosolic Fe-S cluster assembly factor NUBP2 homolog [Hydractinia symbiolongicarpus]|uniref:cytosolic Fe-S cluster assembly factor NUBP2 homolog n=1 Tax=Hydractinia symbiolongicarpus TaxID=13093 RepID=UPI00254BD466|nr:cytosolic Fe-S cluster assembly factor NUBP2 homolog [Hydractinia symbiolongicarpus]